MFSKSINSLYENDKVLKILFDKVYKNKPIRATLILFFVPLILCYIAGYFEDTLENKVINGEKFIGVIQDYTLYTLWIIALLSLLLYYKFVDKTTKFLKDDLPSVINLDKLKNSEDANLEKLDTQLAKRMGAQGWYLYLKMSMIIGFIIFWIINAYGSLVNPIETHGFDIWHSGRYPLGYIILKFFNLIYVSILLPLFFYKFIMLLIGFSTLFLKLAKSDAFIIQPLSPDNCAGLKILSQYSMFFTYFILPFFLIHISTMLRASYELTLPYQISMILLIFLLIVTFFLPLGSVHSAMKRAKGTELKFYSDHFSIHNKDVKEHIRERQFDQDFITDVEALEKLDFLYSQVKKMPVWPFDFSSIARIITALFIPSVAFIVEQINNPGSILNNFLDMM
ncbi:hypothetical protein ACFLS9_02800 [Bacteroidota bacterium]